MIFQTTVTQKGQITLPKQIRTQLGIGSYSRVSVEMGAGFVKVTPSLDILDIAGTFQVKHPESVLKAREVMDKNYSRI